FDLRFYVLAFPSSCHAYSLTHFAAGAGVYKKEISMRRLGAGGAGARDDRERSVHLHDAGERGLSDASEVFREDAVVFEVGGVLRPANLQDPAILFLRLDGACGSDLGGGDDEQGLEM